MQEFLHGAKAIVLYLTPMGIIMFSARKLIKIPDELFRKILHFILLGAYIPFVFAFEHWWVSDSLIVIMLALLYPMLTLAAKIPAFSSFVNERKSGEFRSSMILALTTMLLSITVCWGLDHDRYLVLASVYAWGVGDAFGALIGKPFGKHKIHFKFADHKKSVEGSAAMFVSSMISVFIVMYLRGGISVPGCLLIAVTASLATTFVEMCSKGGFDTITCPLAAMALIIPLTHLLGGK